ncbi:MAG: S9 family peptidase [Ignavibacteriae bacterium]|nr:S9 family peptidase [Ignavibacteriota bacterium]
MSSRHWNVLHRIVLLIFICIVPFALHAQQKKKITPEIAFKTPPLKLTKDLPNITGWEDDASYLESKKKEGEEKAKTYIIDAKTGNEIGEKKPPVNWDDFKTIVDTSIDASKPLQSTKDNLKHLYVKDNDLYLLDVERKEFERLTDNSSEEKNPTFSPDGNYIACTRDNNLFAIDLNSGKEMQYTTDGGEVVYNGWAAWVYWEEIFGRPTRFRAFWWSPDSRRIAFYRFDETIVPMFPIYNSKGQHGSLEKTRYPKAGDPNPMVRFGIVEVTTGNIVWPDFNEKDDQYFGMPFWTSDGKDLWTQWMNRGQDQLKIYSVDLKTGKKRVVYVEEQSSWVEWFEDIHFLKNNKGFIIRTDRDGWSHFYLYSMDGKLKNQMTKGKWQVVNLELIDEDNDMLYFTAKKEASTRTDLYKVKLNGKGLKRLTFGNFTHSVRLSPKGSYFITTYSNVATPQKMALCDNDGNVIRELGDSWQKDLDEYELARTELIRIPTSDGYNLPALLTLPADLDSSKKHPVLISIYGGPNSASVSDGWRLSMQVQGLAAEGLIQLSVDHRASGHFGKEGVALMYRNLGKWEMNDYIEAVKWLRTKPYIDATKICMTGGSYGGYVTCLALTYGADYFTHGVANYSVTDWKLYDTHYTERYMDTPKENPEGYSFGSVITHVDKYKGLLRIVHGTTDDNVHMQNSLQLADTLQNLGKHFEFMLYPNERHGWGAPKSDHSRMETIRFYYKYLLEKEFPEAAFAKKSKT